MVSGQKHFPIVGIGASAGGIEALEGFFQGVSANPGMAFVVVTHLNPERESQLHEIIRRYTSLDVVVASDDTLVKPNCVYVLPSDALLSIENRRLRISKKNPGRRESKPIDIFLSALAKDQGEYAASVVLSGGDGDGTLGTKAIKERGGLTMAQVKDGHGPAHPDMPQSAISTGFVDFPLPADKMGEKLLEFARSLEMLDRMADASSDAAGAEAADRARSEICAIIRNQIGHDFSGYKAKTFLRRVHRRMQVVQLETFEAYVERLRQDAREVNALFRDLLINVTNFFRDADAFEKLKDAVIPKLFEGRGAGDTVRVWVPGCATGEEVFSIAILLREHMDGLRAVPRVQIFATDIDEMALGVARAGRYPEALLDSVSQERRNRFFLPDAGSFVLSKEIRDLCIFSPHSVIRDPPFSRLDLVSCRNLLIYFGSDVQNQVIPIFHYSLRPGGYLFLGTSENVSQFSDLFQPLEKQHRIFRSREDGRRTSQLPMVLNGLRANRGEGAAPGLRKNTGRMALRQSIEGQVLERFAPPHVVVNRDEEVVYFSARTGKYMEPPAGVPTRQLLTLARKGLRLDLRSVFREAVEKNTRVVREGVAVEMDDGRVQKVTLVVEPAWEHSPENPLYLVLFTDEGPSLSLEQVAANTGGIERDRFDGERELRETRDRLQSTIEEYETALEELKSSNEELVSVNEELQSTNEEVEASKEELQSLNEELHTVNAELHQKIEALDQSNADLQNLFESTQIATVFLDRRLVIRSFTPAVEHLFNIRISDRGRPLTDLAGKIDLSLLSKEIRAVFGGASIVERQMQDIDGVRHFMVRIAPYKTSEDHIEGVVLTFIDITTLTHAEAGQRILVAELQHRTRNLLAVVAAIATQTVKSSSDLKEFKAKFGDRLSALSRVQGLLSRTQGDAITIRHLVEMELEALNAEPNDARVEVTGPDVILPDPIIRTLSLALHELATNATKYGALAAAHGSLQVLWEIQPNGEERTLTLRWVESGVDMKRKENSPMCRGFGRQLIERVLPHELGAKTRYEWGDEGVLCLITIPLHHRAQGTG